MLLFLATNMGASPNTNKIKAMPNQRGIHLTPATLQCTIQSHDLLWDTLTMSWFIGFLHSGRNKISKPVAMAKWTRLDEYTGCELVHYLLRGQLCSITHQGELQWQTLAHKLRQEKEAAFKSEGQTGSKSPSTKFSKAVREAKWLYPNYNSSSQQINNFLNCWCKNKKQFITFTH